MIGPKSIKLRATVRRVIQNVDNIKQALIRPASALWDKRGSSLRGKALEFLILSATGQSRLLCYPFHYYRKELRKRFDIEFKEITSDDFAEKQRKLEAFDGDIAFVSLPHRVDGKIFPKLWAIDFFQALGRKKKYKLVFFDVSDSTISPYFGILQYVDLFLMPSTFRIGSDYQKPILGGNIIADYHSKRFQIEPNKSNGYYGDIFYSQIPEDLGHKVLTSWNSALKKRLVTVFEQQDFQCMRKEPRSIDVQCRFNPYSGWCRFHRNLGCENLRELSGKYRIVASEEKIDIRKYFKELEDSKIMFSPFGWGEVPPKDFEAIIKGCLLIKPAVEHLNAYPPVYVPNQTYVPVRWDLTDLNEKVAYYLENDSERRRIIEEASKAYESFFMNQGFLNKIEEILEKLGIK